MHKKHILSKIKPEVSPKKYMDVQGECSVCGEEKELKKLLTDTSDAGIKAICPHSLCEECIEGIIENKETTICKCPLCRKPFTHYGYNMKAVDDYEPDYLKARVLYPKNSLIRSMKGGKTGKRRKTRKNKTQRKQKK